MALAAKSGVLTDSQEGESEVEISNEAMGAAYKNGGYNYVESGCYRCYGRGWYGASQLVAWVPEHT